MLRKDMSAYNLNSMNSIWLEHKDYPGYLFSPEGNCLSLKGLRPKILSKSTTYHGYQRFGLYVDEKLKTVSVHRIIAQIYLPQIESKPQVNHKNGIKSDNCVENLEWVDAFENQQHSRDVLKKDFSHRRGEKSNWAKLTEVQVIEIKQKLKFKTYGIGLKLAKEYNVTTGTISMILNNKIWAHI